MYTQALYFRQEVSTSKYLIRTPCNISRTKSDMHAYMVCANKYHFGDSGSCLVTLAPTWDHVGVTLGPRWNRFGIIMGSSSFRFNKR